MRWQLGPSHNDLYDGVDVEVDEIGALTLVADDGRNISIETTFDAAAAATGLLGVADSVVTGGALQLSSNEVVELNLTAAGVDAAIGFRFCVGKESGMTEDTLLETVTISTAEEARDIDIADSAPKR